MKKLLSLLLAIAMLMTMSVAAFAEDAAETYTYDVAVSEFPTNWNPHQYQTATDNEYMMTYITSGMYDFDFNEDYDGYVVKPLAAAGEPVDVTADYVGEKWNIAEGEVGRAYKITIRDDLKWQDGTPITANDYVWSLFKQINPQAANYRADSLYSGNLVITNAEAYAKQGVASDTPYGQYMGLVGAADMDAFLAEYGDMPGYINWANSFGDTYDFAAGAWTGAAENAVVETGLTVKELYDFYTTGEGAKYATWATPEQLVEWTNDELFAKYTFPEMPAENVGIIAVSDTEFVVVLEKSLVGFYLTYSLADITPVNEALYTQCETVTDGVYNNTYGTTLETTISFGPYMLTSFQSDKQYTFTKNPYWFGWNIPENEGLYQTTDIVYNCVEEPATRLEMFLNGELDSYGLNKDDMDEYSASDYIYYSDGDSVFAMVFNPDLGALRTNEAAAGENINKTILTVKDFRIAMSLGLNRAEFCLAADPTNAPAFALYGNQIVSNPEEGTFYRTTDLAKQVVVNFWGLADEIGEGKLYPTMDDAIDSITGYNLEMAKQYFDAAYDQAIAEGLMDEDDVVEIIIGTPNATSAFYNSGYDFLVNNYTEAVKGTKFEGKLTFKRDSTLGNGFSDALRNNQVDMLFGVGWTGSTFDPYGLMEAYTSTNYQYDPAWDTTTDTLAIEVNGDTFTATVWDWTLAISGTPVKGTNAAGEEVELCFPDSTDSEKINARMTVLAALENCVLMNYDFIPIMGDSGCNLKGMQIEYFLEDEVFPMGRGGIKYMTYNYTDAEWDAFVAEQGGTLNYK